MYLSARWRSDSLVSIPGNTTYPNVFRSQIAQFLDDLRFAFEDIRWVPGKHESIERADSKPRVMACAARLGIKTPSFTVNSFEIDNSLGKKVFRKKLGFPFTVSVNTKKGVEVGVTTTGSQINLGGPIKSKSPWQWQESITAISHVRCCIVEKRVWAVSSDYPSRFSTPQDFRGLNETGLEDFGWKPIGLPDHLKTKLFSLNAELGISLSCPEFLVTRKGEMVFIDLNPCGDWFGFFQDSVNRDIAKTLATQLSPNYR